MNEKRHGCWWTAAAALMALGAADPARAGEIRIWPTAVVSSESVRLADVAQVIGFDEERSRVIRELSVSASPREGGELQIGATEINASLSDAGVNLAEVNLLGASRCRVTRPRHEYGSTLTVRPLPKTGPAKHQPQVVRTTSSTPAKSASTNTLESTLKQFITARAGEKNGKVEIRFSPTSKRDLQLDAGLYQFDIHPRDESKLGLVTLEVDVKAPGEQTRTVPIIAEVSVSREVVVARRAINRGETIEGRHLKLEQRRFTDYSQVGLTDVSAVVGQQARQFVRAGEMLVEHGVEGKPLVRRGDAVTIWIRQGPLVIKASGRAQESGMLGEKIDVARDGSRRKQDVMEAVVTGPSTVTLGSEQRVALGQEGARHE